MLFVQGGSRLLYINASFSYLIEGKKRSYQFLNGLHFGTPIAHVKDGHAWVVERYKLHNDSEKYTLMIQVIQVMTLGNFLECKEWYLALAHDAAVAVLPHLL